MPQIMPALRNGSEKLQDMTQEMLREMSWEDLGMGLGE